MDGARNENERQNFIRKYSFDSSVDFNVNWEIILKFITVK